MKKSKLFSLAIVGSSLLFTSCGSEPTIDEGLQMETIKTIETVADDLFESPDVDYHLPSALQVASIFKKSGMKFNASSMNTTENAVNYISSASQMLNFGVYSADIAYCVTNSQMNEARELITVIQKLADSQGMSAVFDNKDLIDRFNNSLELEDSIEYVMVEIHERTEEYLEENDMMHTSAIHYAGAWIEGMYLGIFDYENNPDNKNIGAQITEQMEILKNIIKGLKDPKNAEVNLESTINGLDKIYTTYNNFESVKTYTNDDNAIELSLTTEEFSEISDLINNIRAQVVKG